MQKVLSGPQTEFEKQTTVLAEDLALEMGRSVSPPPQRSFAYQVADVQTHSLLRRGDSWNPLSR